MTLDAYFLDKARVHLLAIDAEGAEGTILKGANELLARDHPVIVLEAQQSHLRRFGGSLAELKALLEAHEYHVYKIGRLGLGEPETENCERLWNWLALPPALADRAVPLSRHLFWCGILPWLPWLHPLAR